MSESRLEEVFDYLNRLSTRLEALEDNASLQGNGPDVGMRSNSSKGNVSSFLETNKNERIRFRKQTFLKSSRKRIDNSTWNEQSKTKFLPVASCLKEDRKSRLYSSLWIVVNVVSIVVSIVYILNAYNTWQSSPVVQALSNSQVHFDNVSFPGVTICWPNSLNEDYDFSGNIEKCFDCENNTCSVKNETCSRPEAITIALAYLMCPGYSTIKPLPERLYELVPEAIDAEEFDSYAEKLFPACESDMLLTQKPQEGRKRYTRCSPEWQQFYTSNSKRLCTTYNGLRREDVFREAVVGPRIPVSDEANATENPSLIWSFDNMMTFNGDLETVPIYGLEAMYILLTKQETRYANACSLGAINFNSIIIHSPNEIPLHYDNEIEYVISENTLLDLFVEPSITLAREDLSQYPPHQRGCLYGHERNLTMFKFYTKKNCEVECVVDAFLRACGCVPLMYPRHNATIKTCLRPCARPRHRCDCLPDCNSLTFNVRIQDSSISPGPAATPRSLVEVMIWGNKYYKTIRYSISSYAEFLAYSLGVLGVFCGFSVKCVWDLLYFGIQRLSNYVKRVFRKSIGPLQNK